VTRKRFKHVYGPVSSWRLGRSLGIDPVSTGRGKICSFDCVYCQAGPSDIITGKRKIFVPTRDILEEIKSLGPVKIDYITFSGASEPTLAKNLGEIIKGVKKIRKEKVAVLTNSSLLDRKDVRKDLSCADFVAAKLDAHAAGVFKNMSRPEKKIKLKNILKGIKDFKSSFSGRFALQIMFTAGNKKYAEELAKLARDIAADEVYLNTPLRPSLVKPLSKKEMREIKKHFSGMEVITVYERI
jgi:wyosine [tRNA(Phe)-imidazoG37] synthetase (radical SAM superfamily)